MVWWRTPRKPGKPQGVERDEYRRLIRQLFQMGHQLQAMQLLNLEIVARRRGTREELQAVTALRRAMEDFPKTTEQP